MSFGRPVMPGHQQGYPGLLEPLDHLLQERFSQWESRLESKLGLSRHHELDLREILIRVEEKVTSFQTLFDQVEHLNKTTDSILLHLRSGSSGDSRAPVRPGGISVNLLPSRTTQIDGSSMSELCKSNTEILNLLRHIDSKISGDGIKIKTGSIFVKVFSSFCTLRANTMTCQVPIKLSVLSSSRVVYLKGLKRKHLARLQRLNRD
jgi:hypothetical protein